MTKKLILSRETELSGPREWRIKYQILDLKHGFYGVKRQNWVRVSGAYSV